MLDIWPSGHEGVTTLEKASDIWMGVERCWHREVSWYTARRQYVKIFARVTI